MADERDFDIKDHKRLTCISRPPTMTASLSAMPAPSARNCSASWNASSLQRAAIGRLAYRQ